MEVLNILVRLAALGFTLTGVYFTSVKQYKKSSFAWTAATLGLWITVTFLSPSGGQ